MRMIFFYLTLFTLSRGLSENPMHIILHRLETKSLAERKPNVTTSAREWVGSLDSEGLWPDIEYEGQTSPGFSAFPHIERMSALALEVHQTGDPELRQACIVAYQRALAAWVHLDLIPVHEWFYTMGVPLQLSRSLVLMRHHLSEPDLTAALPLLRTSDENGVTLFGPHPATGANLIWSAFPQLIAGLLSENQQWIERAVKECEGEIKITSQEGLQTDGSFHQHGPLLYNGGYGGAFVREISELAALLRDTPYAFPPEKIELIRLQLLEGQQWMIRGENWDFGVTGREISRQGQAARAQALAADNGIEFDPEYTEAYRALAARIRMQEDALPLSGNRMYWRSDFMVSQQPGWYASARMSSTRMKGHESGNGENEKGFHLGDGVTTLMRDGKEYAKIFPLWNWKQLPGLTAAQTRGEVPVLDWGRGSQGGSDFAGGVSNGRIGVSAMILHRDGTAARKAWFFFSDSVVCLGSGIARNIDDAPVHTTLNQTEAHDPVLVNGVRLRGESELEFPAWIYHDGWGYLVLTEGKGIAVNEQRSGSWTRINKGGDPNMFTANIFSAWIDHGPRPQNAGYAYILRPEVKSDELPEKLAQALSNPPLVQSEMMVARSETDHALGAVLFSPGAYEPAPGFFIKSDRALTLIYEEQTRVLHVASPLHESGPLHLTINGMPLQLRLPDVARAGGTLSISLDNLIPSLP